MSVNRDNTGRFVKGNKSGGRPKQPEEFKTTVRENSVAALRVVLDIMNNKDACAADRLKAASIIIERAYGKAPQSVEMSVVNTDAADELERYFAMRRSGADRGVCTPEPD